MVIVQRRTLMVEEKMAKRPASLIAGTPTSAAQKTGYVHAYFGAGKGKTTAAIGLAVRAAGAGYRICFIQFDKGHDPGRGEHYAERAVLRTIAAIDFKPTGCERIRQDGTFRFGVEAGDRDEALRGINLALTAISEHYDMVVLDEILAGLAYNLLTESEVLAVLDAHAASEAPCELIMTGHKLPEAIKTRTHLVTEMRKIKHYFDEGVPARLGIEF